MTIRQASIEFNWSSPGRLREVLRSNPTADAKGESWFAHLAFGVRTGSGWWNPYLILRLLGLELGAALLLRRTHPDSLLERLAGIAEDSQRPRWVARWSTTGRGFRLHPIGPDDDFWAQEGKTTGWGFGDTPREALEQFVQRNYHSWREWARKRAKGEG